MESYQVLIQISLYVFCFAIGAVIEHFNLKHDQIICRIIEKLVIKMKKLEDVLSLSVIVIILLLIFVFFRDSITTYNAYFNFGLTFLLVAINYLMVSETNKMRKAQTQPNVYVFFEPADELNGIVELSIQNIGSGVAHNIKFTEMPVFQYSKNKFFSDVYLIKNGIQFLAPHQKLQVFMTQTFEIFELNSLDPINVKIEYSDGEGEEFKVNYRIDFSVVLDVQRMKSRYTNFENSIIESTKKLNSSLSNISLNVKTISNNLIVNTGNVRPNISLLLAVTENHNRQVEIAKTMVKTFLIGFCNDWKSYKDCNQFLGNPDPGHIVFISHNKRLTYHLNQFIFVSNEIDAVGVLPEVVSTKLVEFAAKMRVIESKSDIVSHEAWGREYPSSIPNQFDELLDDIKKMYENLDDICGTV